MDIIKVKPEDTKYPNDNEVLLNAIKIANGILANIKYYGWCDGERNNQAVDYMIAIYILGIDIDVAKNILIDQINNWANEHNQSKNGRDRDIEDFEQRCDIIQDYLDGWYDRSVIRDMIFMFACNDSQEIYWYKQAQNGELGNWNNCIQIVQE